MDLDSGSTTAPSTTTAVEEVANTSKAIHLHLLMLLLLDLAKLWGTGLSKTISKLPTPSTM